MEAARLVEESFGLPVNELATAYCGLGLFLDPGGRPRRLGAGAAGAAAVVAVVLADTDAPTALIDATKVAVAFRSTAALDALEMLPVTLFGPPLLGRRLVWAPLRCCGC